MKLWKRLVEKCKRFIEDASRANEKMWKGKTPSCCNKEKKQ